MNLLKTSNPTKRLPLKFKGNNILKDLEVDELLFISPVPCSYNPTLRAIVNDSDSSLIGEPSKHALQGKVKRGVDIEVDMETSVVASERGIVVLAGKIEGYGRVIYINHSNGVQTRYAHLTDKDDGIKLKFGDIVKRGQIIGKTGATIDSTLSHLHYEIHAITLVSMMDVADQLEQLLLFKSEIKKQLFDSQTVVV